MRAVPNESPLRLSTVGGPELHTLHVPHLQQDVRPWLLAHLSPQEEAPLPVAARAQSLQVSARHPVCSPSLLPLLFFLTFMVLYGHRNHKAYYTLFRSAPDTQCEVLLFLHFFFFLTFMVLYGHRNHKAYYTLFRSAPDTQCEVLLFLQILFFLTFMVLYGHRNHKAYYTLFRSAPDTQCEVLLFLHFFSS